MKPYFEDDTREAADFAMTGSGGDDYPGLVEVEAFAKSLNVRREPERGQLGLLAKAQVRRKPKWPLACLKALFSASDNFCKRKGESYMFTSADIRAKEGKLMPQVQEAPI